MEGLPLSCVTLIMDKTLVLPLDKVVPPCPFLYLCQEKKCQDLWKYLTGCVFGGVLYTEASLLILGFTPQTPGGVFKLSRCNQRGLKFGVEVTHTFKG